MQLIETDHAKNTRELEKDMPSAQLPETQQVLDTLAVAQVNAWLTCDWHKQFL